MSGRRRNQRINQRTYRAWHIGSPFMARGEVMGANVRFSLAGLFNMGG
jgi:hypothetical protein